MSLLFFPFGIGAGTAISSSTAVAILINGVDARTRVRKGSLQIRDILNQAPNTCASTVGTTAAVAGQSLRVTVGSTTLFAGANRTVDLSYEGRPIHKVWPCTAIDDTARVNRRRPFGTWVNVSATTIAQSLVTNFSSGFTSVGVAASLPAVSVTFDGSTSFMGCLGHLATLIGGYCKVEDGVVYLFLTDTSAAPDAIDTTPGRFLDDPPITMSTDLSQLRTRVYGKGHAEAIPSDVLSAETIIPIADAVMFNASGGKAIASTTADGAASQILSYAGVQLGGGGSLVGPGVAPSAVPTLALAAGTGMGTGVYQYAYTHVTAAGESLPSPLATITTGVLAPPFKAPDLGGPFAGSLDTFAFYNVAVTYQTALGETTTLFRRAFTTDNNGGWQYTIIPIGPTGTTGRRLYRTDGQASAAAASTAQLKLLTTIANNTTTAFNDGIADASLGANVPTTNTATALQVELAGIALGPAGTTARKVYRTAVGGAQLKLQQTIANNTATVGVTDTTADGSLGANVVTSDTSGLTQPAGQVNAGSTSLILASAGPFSAGWVLLSGGQIVRYTGITGNTLTGIPASGVGAILTTVLYGQQAVPSPALTGVTGLSVALAKGSNVHIWVERNDAPAQAAMAAIEGGDGIYEYLISDERRGEASLTALCDADLAMFKSPIATVRYATRDLKTKSGKTVHIDLATLGIVGDFVIQEVLIDQIDIATDLGPRFIVTASSVRFSLEAILQRLITEAA
jgi:hypothetical protein